MKESNVQNIHVDRAIDVRINLGIIQIMLGSDDFSDIATDQADGEQIHIKPTTILSMPVAGFIETLNLFKDFTQDSAVMQVLSAHVKAGVLQEMETINNEEEEVEKK